MKDFKLGTWSQGQALYMRGRDVFEPRIKALADAGVTIVIPVLDRPFGRQGVNFVTDATDVDPEYPDWDPLMVFTDQCREAGIEVHTWLCCFKSGANPAMFRKMPQAEAQFNTSPDWPDGKEQGVWACGCQPRVQQYMLDLYRSIAERYRPAGLHLDFIRTGSQCACDYCRSEMAERGVDTEAILKRYESDRDGWLEAGSRGILRKYAAMGVVEFDDDGEFVDEELDQWIAWRMDRLTGFVADMQSLAREYDMVTSAAVKFFWPRQSPTGAQDWVRWAREDLLDYLMVMLYTNDNELVAKEIARHQSLIKGHKCEHWLGLGRVSRDLASERFEEQIHICRNAGLDGIVAFQEPTMTDADFEVLSRF